MACTRGVGDKCYTGHVLRKQLGHGGWLPCDGRDRARHPLRSRPRGHLGVVARARPWGRSRGGRGGLVHHLSARVALSTQC